MKPRYVKIKDHNHDELVSVLIQLGGRVIDMSGVGDKFPDLLVLCGERLLIVEVKNLKTGYGKRGLNPGQREFATWWHCEGGTVYVIHNADDCRTLVSPEDRHKLAFKPTADDINRLSVRGK